MFDTCLGKDLAAAQTEAGGDYHKLELAAIIPGQYLLEMTRIHIFGCTIFLFEHEKIPLVLVTFPCTSVLRKRQLIILKSVTRKVQAHGSKSQDEIEVVFCGHLVATPELSARLLDLLNDPNEFLPEGDGGEPLPVVVSRRVDHKR